MKLGDRLLPRGARGEQLFCIVIRRGHRLRLLLANAFEQHSYLPRPPIPFLRDDIKFLQDRLECLNEQIEMGAIPFVPGLFVDLVTRHIFDMREHIEQRSIDLRMLVFQELNPFIVINSFRLFSDRQFVNRFARTRRCACQKVHLETPFRFRDQVTKNLRNPRIRHEERRRNRIENIRVEIKVASKRHVRTADRDIYKTEVHRRLSTTRALNQPDVASLLVGPIKRTMQFIRIRHVPSFTERTVVHFISDEIFTVEM